ncbi:MAG: DoxX family protein [Bacteroidia bacterium]|jgi:hypothetical protein|nr:DoxX family protein [Bacteroidia bacterium]
MQGKIIESFIAAFFTILFIQSGLDKVINWKDELAFNKEHFSKTFLKPFVPLLLGILTVLELSSGLLSATGVVSLWMGSGILYCYACCLCAVTLLCLFFGQRIAKDYGGAQALVAYFIVALLGIAWLTL